MNPSPKRGEVTVSELAELIARREETRAELRVLALEAYEQWRALEAKIDELEARFDSSFGEVSEVKLRVAAALAFGEGGATPEPK